MPAKAAKRPRPATRAAVRRKPAKSPSGQPKRAKTAAKPQAGRFATDSAEIDARLKSMGTWHAATMAHLRRLAKDADPGVTEEVKWRKPSNGMAGVPTYSHDGLLFTMETYKAYVKLTFAHGAALADPSRLFNAGFGGGTRRAIDLREGERVDESAFRALVKEAVAFNQAA